MSRASSPMNVDGARRASTRSRTSPRAGRLVEGHDLERPELRLPLVAAVDAALDDEDGVLVQVLAARGVGGAEDDDLDLVHRVVEAHEGHRLAPLATTSDRDGGHDPADRDDRRPRAGSARSRERHVDAAAQLVAHLRQRMAGQVQAERLLLEGQQLAALELRPDQRRVVARRGRRLGRRRGRRSTPGRAARRPAPSAPPPRPMSSTPSMLRRVAPGGVEGAALDQALEHALVDLLPRRRARRSPRST